MNAREKILATAVGSLVGVFVIGFGVRAALIKPLKDIDRRINASKLALEKINADKRLSFSTEDRMKLTAAATFGETVDQASATSGEIITKRILQSGLEENDFTRLPSPPRKLKGASEIGWIVQGEGPLTNIVSLLFVLDNSPYLHRVENMSLLSGDAPGRVKVRFRYLTLALDPSPEVTRKPLPDKFALDSAERRGYDDIVARDLFRPYIKRPPPPAPPANSSNPGGSAPPNTPPGPESFKIVSLSEWNGQPEIHVLDGTGQRTTRYKAGDQLAGGTIVCVDYRELPVQGSFALSESRVILKVGADFWAIERGRTLADKYKMAADQLPQDLTTAVK